MESRISDEWDSYVIYLASPTRISSYTCDKRMPSYLNPIPLV